MCVTDKYDSSHERDSGEKSSTFRYVELNLTRRDLVAVRDGSSLDFGILAN